MGRYASLAGAVMLAVIPAVAAHAQEEVSPLVVNRPGVLFISPAGEPFRGGADMTKSMRIWFDQADANHDGALTWEEFLADHMRFFKLLDQHDKGYVDGFDVGRYEHEIVPELIADYEHTGSGRPGPKGAAAAPRPLLFSFGAAPGQRQGAGAFGLLNEAEPIRIADADFDFHITVEEWTARAKFRFQELDANGNGKITFDELKLPPDPWE
jgi:hypothetical protein